MRSRIPGTAEFTGPLDQESWGYDEWRDNEEHPKSVVILPIAANINNDLSLICTKLT
jgi:hypothetical protein